MKKVPLVAVEKAIGKLNFANSLFLKSAKSTTNRNGLFLDAIQYIEELCLEARKEALACATAQEDREAIIDRSLCNLDISVVVTEEGFLHVVIPRMLPNKKRAENTALITEPLKYQLQRTPNIPYLSGVQTLIIQHNYRADTPELLIRDHDNYEVKQVTDVICHYCMPDDSIKYCDRLHLSATAETPSTDIWVVPSAKLIYWLENHKK